MEPRMIKRPDAQVLGVMHRINPMEADYGELWEKEYMPRHRDVEALASEAGHYGVYYATDEENMADFVSGMLVDESTAAPEGLTLRPIPGGDYAAFECTMGSIGPTWGDIYSKWLPSSGYQEDESRPSIEYYSPETEDEQSPVTIMIPVKPRQ